MLHVTCSMIIGIDGRPLQEKFGGVKEYTLNLLHALFCLDSKNEYHIFYNSFKSPPVEGERPPLNLPLNKGEIEGDFVRLPLCKRGTEGDFSQYPNVHIHRFHWPNKLLNLSMRLSNWPKLDKLTTYNLQPSTPLDLFWMPNLNFASFSPGFKYILTVHDLSFHHFPDFYSLKQRLWHKALGHKKLLRDAAKIVAVSEHTKNDLTETFNLPPKKIEVIFPCVDVCHCEEPALNAGDEVVPKADPPWADNPDKTGLPRSPAKAGSLAMTNGYILYLGTLEPRKNIEGLIEAYKILKEKNPPQSPFYKGGIQDSLPFPPEADPPLEDKKGELERDFPKLVIAGPKGWKYQTIFEAAKIQPRLKAPHLSPLPIGERQGEGVDIIFLDQVSEKEKIALYQNAKLFVFPSFYEGFGLPPLEAASFGVPVIASSASSLPEVLADAAFYVNPWNVSEIAEAMALLLTNDELRQKLSQAGPVRAQKFQTNESAKKLLQLFEEVANK